MTILHRPLSALLACCATLFAAFYPGMDVRAQTSLSDVPLFSASSVPANLMLALSVEFPTGTVAAYTDAAGFSTANSYLGYFDNTKCYTYQSSATPINNYFISSGPIAGGICATGWSGNMLNWASMTALDEFRQALTGGNRIVDTAGLTVLERSRQTAQGSAGNFPTKTLTPPTGLVPAPFATFATTYIRTHNGGTELTLNGDKGVFIEVSNNSTFTHTPTSNPAKYSILYYARVKVCETAGGNCTQYSGGYKPEGLIQQNANRIRVGAAGYLNRNGNDHPNGVIRSLIRDVGPTKYNGLAARSTNPYREWDASTGVFLANPDSANATASGVTNSGAINYLNKFGTAQPYMTYDTISELYWSALAHYMQVPLDASYTAGVTVGSAPYDGFPVISTTAHDPGEYSCQGNSIVVIADSHTWCDSRVPGSAIDSSGTSGCANQTPLPAVNGLNAGASATALGALPLLEANSNNSYSPTATVSMPGAYGSNLGGQFAKTGAGSATYNIAGMAYFAHTKDIRADNPSIVGTTDKQTVDTFVVDVMEPGGADNNSAGNATFDPNNFNSGGRGPNQYWLAAKYGGFDDINNDGVPANYLTWHTNTTQGTNTRPDNLFPGNRADLIQSGMAQIFNRVSSKKPQSAAGPGLSAGRSLAPVSSAIFHTGAATGFATYLTKYIPGDWSGDILGAISSIAPDGSVTQDANAQWSAQARLQSMVQIPSGSVLGWDSTRRIVTFNGTTGIEFRLGSLSAAQKTALGGTATNQQKLLNFLRGDRSNEGTLFRSRKSVLGDIVNSEAVLVQASLSPSFTDTANPGYAAFRAAQASRAPVVYVGSNDGMLHAFAADFSMPVNANDPSGGGSELFAYVPSFMFAGPNNTPLVDGLAALANLAGVTTNAFSHHFYVDQTPQAADVDFNRTSTNPTGSTGSPNWHTILVGAVGKGGKGVYALDITTVPAALSVNTSAAQETLIKQKVLWEFAPSDMGYVYSKPVIAKTRKYGWVVAITSGYNNTGGVGHLYILNARTGVLLEKFDTSVGTNADPSGLSRPSGYTQDFSDNTLEQIYAGDLKGNVWRFDVSSGAAGSYPAPVLFGRAIDPSGNGQPITTAPRIEVDVDSTGLGTRRWVFVGTGQFLAVNDLTTTQQQTMYAFRDGDAAAPSTTGLPLARSSLTQLTDLIAGITISDSASGWYYDLTNRAGNATDGATERIVVDPDSLAGVPLIVWATLVPTTDPCTYKGAIYAADFGTGKSALIDANGNPVASIMNAHAVTKVQLVQDPGDGTGSPQIKLIYGDSGLNIGSMTPRQSATMSPVSRTNWREVLN